MIFVTTGTERHPFDRLVVEVDRLAAAGAFANRRVLIQTGSCKFLPQVCETVGLLTYGEMVERVRASRLVIAHGGVGSFMLCRRYGVPLLMVPRLRRFGENVDDHQVTFCRHLAALGLLESVEDVVELGDRARRLLETSQGAGEGTQGGRLTSALINLTAPSALELKRGHRR